MSPPAGLAAPAQTGVAVADGGHGDHVLHRAHGGARRAVWAAHPVVECPVQGLPFGLQPLQVSPEARLQVPRVHAPVRSSPVCPAPCSRPRCGTRFPRSRSPRPTRPHIDADRGLGHGVLRLDASGPTLRRPSLAHSDFRSPQLCGLLRSKGVTTRLTNGLGWPDPGIFAICHAPPQSPAAAGDCGGCLTY